MYTSLWHTARALQRSRLLGKHTRRMWNHSRVERDIASLSFCIQSLSFSLVPTTEMDNIHNSTANFTKPVTTSAANSTFFYYSNASSSTSLSSLTDHVGKLKKKQILLQSNLPIDIILIAGTEVETIFTGQSSPLTTPSSPSSASNQFTNNISQASNITGRKISIADYTCQSKWKKTISYFF